MRRTIVVAAAVIRRQDGHVLIARRRVGKAFAGKWEFPGGKIEEGETPEQCLVRELHEEFSIETAVEGYIISSQAAHEDIVVELHAYAVNLLGGTFQLTDHDQVAWVAPRDLTQYEMPEADIAVVNALIT